MPSLKKTSFTLSQITLFLLGSLLLQASDKPHAVLVVGTLHYSPELTMPVFAKVNLTDALPAFAKRAREDVLSFAKGDKPFFLYIPLTSPHSPVVPNKPFQGKTNIGSYGDFVVETDWVIPANCTTCEKILAKSPTCMPRNRNVRSPCWPPW